MRKFWGYTSESIIVQRVLINTSEITHRHTPPTSEIEWLCVDVDGYKIVNVYKPPPTRLRSLDLPMFPHPCLYAGDFNCRHADWGYDDNSPDGECLAGWASINCLALLYNAKDAASFYSGAGTLAPIQI